MVLQLPRTCSDSSGARDVAQLYCLVADELTYRFEIPNYMFQDMLFIQWPAHELDFTNNDYRYPKHFLSLCMSRPVPLASVLMPCVPEREP